MIISLVNSLGVFIMFHNKETFWEKKPETFAPLPFPLGPFLNVCLNILIISWKFEEFGLRNELIINI